MSARHDDDLRRVWDAHDGLHLSIPQIAKRLGMTEPTVHACIIEVWTMTNSERVSVGLKSIRGWEDE